MDGISCLPFTDEAREAHAGQKAAEWQSQDSNPRVSGSLPEKDVRHVGAQARTATSHSASLRNKRPHRWWARWREEGGPACDSSC